MSATTKLRPSLFFALLPLLLAVGCVSSYLPGSLAPRIGDEIMVAGRLVHTGTPVVLWTDPDGYDAYRVERRFSPWDSAGWDSSQSAVKALSTPNRYGLRRGSLSDEQVEQFRGGGWDLKSLQQTVDQFVLHFDASGTSRQCFKILHDLRGLSVHFLLDIDGTIYQTLDLKERAWHATIANTRSVGVEIAQIGAYPLHRAEVLTHWYQSDSEGTRITLPAAWGDGGIRDTGCSRRPIRSEPIVGTVQHQQLVQYDFTPEQYAALIKLTATLCRVFPRLTCDFPRDPHGVLVPHKLPDPDLERFQGVLGHFHIQANKVDPGPAFQWEWFLAETRRVLRTCKTAELFHQRRLGNARIPESLLSRP